MQRSFSRWRSRWWWGTLVCLLATLLVVLLYAACVPFYAGSRFGAGSCWSWRLEHGRLMVKHTPSPWREQFYVDINTEGMRFAPEFRYDTWSNWWVNVPLWAPLAACIVATGASYWRYRRRRARALAGTCRRCGYVLAGLPAGAACPECGREPAQGQRG